MSQTDMNVANGSGAVVRADINAHLDAIATQHSGATAPSPTFANQPWFDTANNLMKVRDNANTAWVTIASKSGTTWIPYASGAAMELFTIASQAEAEAGVDNTNKGMTPLRTKQAIDALVRAAAGSWSNRQYFADHTDESASNAITFDFVAGNIVEVLLDENITSITLSNIDANGIYEIWITQAAASSFTVSGWSGITWHTTGGVAPSMPSTNDAMMVIQLRKNAAGIFGSVQNAG